MTTLLPNLSSKDLDHAPRVVLLTRGTAGDITPFIEIGSALTRRGNDVLLITHCMYASVALRAGVPFAPLDTAEEYRAFLRDGHLLETMTGFKEFSDRQIFPKLEWEVEFLQDRCWGPRTVLVTRHMAGLAASIVCERLSLPLVTVFLSAAQVHAFDLWIDLCRSALAEKINHVRQRFNVPEIADWRAWASQPDLFVACWPAWFAQEPDGWTAPFKHAGFVRSETAEGGAVPAEVEELLESEAPPILITGGTSIGRLASKFYSVVAEACCRAGRNALLVCPHDELVPSRLPAGVRRFAALPFASVMPRVPAVIHHGGSGTMIRAMASGTPQVVLPFGADRPDNAARIEKLRIGVQIRPVEWEPEHVARLLEQVIASQAARCELNAVRNRLSSPGCLEDACAAIEQLVAPRWTNSPQPGRL